MQSHYSIKKASAALGFGTENLILLSTDERFVEVLYSDRYSISIHSTVFIHSNTEKGDLNL